MVAFDPTWVGSLTDLATLVVVISLGFRLREKVTLAAAALVALARRRPGVDDDRLQDDLDVDERAVRAVETTIVESEKGGE
jgi:hypothetical protein